MTRFGGSGGKFHPGVKAGRAVLECGQPVPDKIKCDVDEITLLLHVKDGPSVTVRNTAHAALATGLVDVPAGWNDDLKSHAAVIHFAAPMITADARSGPSRMRTSEGIGASRSGTVVVQAKADERCPEHLGLVGTPDLAKDSKSPPNERALKVGTQDWEIIEFLKALFQGNLRQFVYPATSEAVFAVTACGNPGSGDPIKALTGKVALTAADEWIINFRWSDGFQMKFAQSSSIAKAYRDGGVVESSSRSIETKAPRQQAGKEKSVDTTVRKDGKLEYYTSSTAGSSLKTEIIDKDASSIESKARQRAATEAELKDVGGQKTLLDTGLENAEKLNESGLALSIQRNGKEILNTQGWADTIESVKSFINAFLDMAYRLQSGMDAAAKFAIPVSLSLKISLDVTLLQGSVRMRFFPEMRPLRQSATYYLQDFKTCFAIGVDLTIVDVTLTSSLTAMIKFVHEYVASTALTITGTFRGTVKASYELFDYSKASAYKFGGNVRFTASAKVEGQAFSCYVVGSASATSGVAYSYTFHYDGSAINRTRHDVVSHSVEVRLTARYGNKIWDMLGFGSDDPDLQWPPDGPFVWVREGLITRHW